MRKPKEKTPLFSIECDLKMQEMFPGNGILEVHILNFFPGKHVRRPPETLMPTAIMGMAMPGLRPPLLVDRAGISETCILEV